MSSGEPNSAVSEEAGESHAARAHVSSRGPRVLVGEVSARLLERGDAIMLRRGGPAEPAHLWEDEPHPVALLAARAQFCERRIVRSPLRGDETLEIGAAHCATISTIITSSMKEPSSSISKRSFTSAEASVCSARIMRTFVGRRLHARRPDGEIHPHAKRLEGERRETCARQRRHIHSPIVWLRPCEWSRNSSTACRCVSSSGRPGGNAVDESAARAGPQHPPRFAQTALEIPPMMRGVATAEEVEHAVLEGQALHRRLDRVDVGEPLAARRGGDRSQHLR